MVPSVLHFSTLLLLEIKLAVTKQIARRMRNPCARGTHYTHTTSRLCRLRLLPCTTGGGFPYGVRLSCNVPVAIQAQFRLCVLSFGLSRYMRPAEPWEQLRTASGITLHPPRTPPRPTLHTSPVCLVPLAPTSPPCPQSGLDCWMQPR